MTIETKKSNTGVRDDHYRLSPSAVTCARTRAFYTDMPYVQDILNEVTSGSRDTFGEFWHNFLMRAVYLFPDLMTRAAILEGRYLSTSDAISRLGECSFLEIAAGLSPRSLELAKGDVLYIETDQQEVIEAKEKIVRSIRTREGIEALLGHIFIPLNPLYIEEMRKIGGLYSRNPNKKPIIIIHEGFFEWQTRDEQLRIRDNIRDFLKEYSPNGAWISPDFTFTTRDNFVMRLIMRKMQRDAGRKFTVFENDDEIQDFLNDGELKGEKLPNEHLIEKLTCINKIGISKRKVEELAKHFQAYIITLK